MFGQQVQEFLRQVVARKVTVHACGGLITLNLSLITTVIYYNNLLITFILYLYYTILILYLASE